ncbi:histidine phosphotransferase family protein [Pseudoponticoccus marisrubri]|uniref:Histidine phosphotransferase ChpT C-terminal domain-containing protein n=1 Tax=Pseudoponticoccus marisrubri TaxID=1685382 RepID=A0A0W7WLL1_9RHOB|nr:histidine phosphotransferase family protein [Pseudoponticoccus marisrubri]KUF11415.1 hypothetical protein AVJ23_06520 [Pseudoponticoccus marisrubri]
MPHSSAALAALVGSRLCHDLISPIGAIQNGLELLSLSGSGSGKLAPEMELIQDSCESAAARIRFFRVAFGSAGDGQLMARRDVLAIFDDLGRGGRLSANWQPTEDLPRAEVQLAFLAYLCCEAALPQGGVVQLGRDAAGWRIRAEGRRLTIRPELWDHVNGVDAPFELTPDRVQFAMLVLLAEERGHKLLAAPDDTGLTLTIA